VKFAPDTEFIDTPLASELITLALVAADGRELGTEKVSFKQAARMIREFVGGSRFDPPEFWAFYAAYDWYWFSRVFGGFMEFPHFYPKLCRDLAYLQQDLPNIARPEHFALNDARSLMHAMRLRGLASEPNSA
jgi:hypothetical protein